MFPVKWGTGHQGENKRSPSVLYTTLEHCGSSLAVNEKTASLLLSFSYPFSFPISICKTSVFAK